MRAGERATGVASPSGPALLAAALPLAAVVVVDPGGDSPFGPAKWAAVSVAVLVLAAAVVRGRSRVVRGPALAWAAFLAVGALAAAFGLDRLYAWTGTPERHLGWFTWLLCALAFLAGQNLDRRAGKAAAVGATLAVGIAGAWAVAETTGWEPIDLLDAGDRPIGPLGSSAFLGAAAVLLAPVAGGVALTLRRRQRQERAGLAALSAATLAAGLGAVALVASGARAAWAGALVAAVVVVLCAVRSLRRQPAANGTPPPAAISRLVLGVGATVALCAGLALATGVSGRIPDALSDRDGGARGRLDEWRVATRVIASRPLLGAGPEGYRIAFSAHVDEGYEQAHGRHPLPDRAHSAVLDVAATTGLPGLMAYAALLATTGPLVIRGLGDHRDRPWVAGLTAGLVAYAAQSLFLFPVAELDVVAWLLAGVVCGVVATDKERVTLPSPLARAVPVGAVLLAALATVVGVFDVAADRAARTTLSQLATGRLPRGDRAANLRPDVVRYHLVAARAGEARGTVRGLNTALGHVEQALDVSPRDPVARSEQGRLQLERAKLSGDPEHARRALQALEDLVATDARNAAHWLRLGVAADLTADPATAERAWLTAERLAPRSPAASIDLAITYARTERWADARAAAHRALTRQPAEPRALDVLRRADEAEARSPTGDPAITAPGLDGT